MSVFIFDWVMMLVLRKPFHLTHHLFLVFTFHAFSLTRLYPLCAVLSILLYMCSASRVSYYYPISDEEDCPTQSMDDEESSRATPEFGKVTANKHASVTWTDKDTKWFEISLEYHHHTNTHSHTLPWPLSSAGLLLDRESTSSRRGLFLQQGSSLSWYINASTAAGTGSCWETHTPHKETIVKHEQWLVRRCELSSSLLQLMSLLLCLFHFFFWKFSLINFFFKYWIILTAAFPVSWFIF